MSQCNIQFHCWVSVCYCVPERMEVSLSQTSEGQEELFLRRKLVPLCPRPTWHRTTCHELLTWGWEYFVPHEKHISSTSRTLVFIWLQVLWLSWALPVQFSQHEYGDIVVLLLQSDGVQHWRKADINQTHPCFLQHLPASALLPRLPLNDINKCHIHWKSSHSGLSPVHVSGQVTWTRYWGIYLRYSPTFTFS